MSKFEYSIMSMWLFDDEQPQKDELDELKDREFVEDYAKRCKERV